MTGGGILFYNKIVDLENRLHGQSKNFEQAKLANVELKNQLYQLLDAKHLLAAAAQMDLIEIKKPEFLPLASNHESLTSAQ